ncbi:MAG: ABC transporter ATP-binding protein [Deltaproteobacteria bacterium]|nr:ABC transporter ATP-binding protein [Deltaproteobacteria bacterium]
MNEPAILFDRVSKSYHLYHPMTGGIKSFLFHLPEAVKILKNSRYEVLKEVTFQVGKGESLGIIGRNGAGKSTLLGLIAGIIKPTQGKIAVQGRISSLLELGGGFHPELTGRENIVMNGVLLGLTKNEVFQKMDEIIEFSDLGDFIDQPIKIYSSGMLARLGFSVVANLDPEILLIDEILAVGDMEFQKKCLKKMMDFKKSGATMVFVSHSMENIKLLCDRVIWIDRHTIKIVGSPEEVIPHYV